MKFEKYIYIWDIHWKKEFCKFIDERDDWKTFFILMWDLFDRWNYSYEVIEKIKEKHKEWKLHLILWNHDLFLIFWYLLNWSRWTFKWQFDFNGWKNTYDSFEKNVKYRWLYQKNWETCKSVLTYIHEVCEFLLNNFDLYYVDELWNLSIHWWIPFLFDWTPIWDSFWFNDYKEWFEYVKELNKLMKQKDELTLSKLTWIHETDSIVRAINSVHWLWIQNYKIEKDFTQFVPTWYLNRNYDENKDIYDWMIKELDKYWFNRFFCWHDWKYIIEDKNVKDDRIIRLDRHIWFAVFNNKNELIESWLILTQLQESHLRRYEAYISKMTKQIFDEWNE